MTFSNATVVLPSEGYSVFLGDLGAIVKVVSTATSSGVGVVEHTLPPGALGAPPHRHSREDEISYILEGELTVMQGDEVVTVGTGAFVIKRRGVFHTFWNAGKLTVRFLEIIAPGGFETYFEERARLMQQTAPPDQQQLAALRDRYALEFDTSRLAEIMQKYGVKLTGSSAR